MGATISRLTGSKKARMPIVPTDDVLPMHPFDGTGILKGCTLMWTARFDEVLDADKLNNALSQLFQMDGWRRLGGRIRLSDNGKIEVHVPREFTAERPAVYFTKEAHDMRFQDHPKASELPTTANKLTVFQDPVEYKSLGVGPGTPECFEDFISSDAPQFSLHVVTFTDGTLVSLVFSHMTSDLGGLSIVLDNWRLVLAGKPEQVSKFPGYKDDAMAGLYRSGETERPKVDGSLLQGWRVAVWALRAAFEGWWTPYQGHLVRVPGKVIDALVEEARRDISLEATADGSKPFVSENDVVLALINHCVAQNKARGRSLVTLIAVNPRDRMKSIFKDDSAYVQNAPCAAFFYCPVQDALDLPLGKVALLSRRAIAEQLTEAQIKATAKAAYDSMIEGGNPPLVGDATTALIVSSNWAKSGFLDKGDFSPAILKHAEEKKGKPGHPVYYHMKMLEGMAFPTSAGINMGRDADRNLWLTGDLSAATWTALTDYLRKYE